MTISQLKAFKILRPRLISCEVPTLEIGQNTAHAIFAFVDAGGPELHLVLLEAGVEAFLFQCFVLENTLNFYAQHTYTLRLVHNLEVGSAKFAKYRFYRAL